MVKWQPPAALYQQNKWACGELRCVKYEYFSKKVLKSTTYLHPSAQSTLLCVKYKDTQGSENKGK